MNNGGRVVFGVLALELRIGHDAGAQFVVHVVVTAPHTFVDGVFNASGETFPAHVHANFEEDVDDAGVLADRAAAFRAHLGVGQDLRDGVFGGGALLKLIGPRQVADVVGWVVVADVLQRGSYAFDQVFLMDGAHGMSRKNEAQQGGLPADEWVVKKRHRSRTRTRPSWQHA